MTYTITAVPKNDGRFQTDNYFKVKETGFEGTRGECERYCTAHTMKTKVKSSPTLRVNWTRMIAKLSMSLKLKSGQTRKIFDLLSKQEREFILLLLQYKTCEIYAQVEGRNPTTIWDRFYTISKKIKLLKAEL